MPWTQALNRQKRLSSSAAGGGRGEKFCHLLDVAGYLGGLEEIGESLEVVGILGEESKELVLTALCQL